MSIGDIETTDHFGEHDMSASDKLHMITSVFVSLKPDRKQNEWWKNESERRILSSDTAFPLSKMPADPVGAIQISCTHRRYRS